MIEIDLDEAEAVLVSWSPDAAKSVPVRSKATEGFETGRFVQVIVKKTKLPLVFNQLQSIDLTDCGDRADDPRIIQLVEELGGVEWRKSYVNLPKTGRKTAAFVAEHAGCTSCCTPEPQDAATMVIRPVTTDAVARRVVELPVRDRRPELGGHSVA